MKTNIALALVACTLTSQAVNMRITHHDLTKLSFAVGDRTAPGYFPLRDEITQGSLTSIVGISAVDVGRGEFQISVNWAHPTFPQSDTFRIPLGRITFPTFDGASYQYLFDTQEWEWTYLAPVPGEGIPDNGNVLAGLGVALLGVWRIRK